MKKYSVFLIAILLVFYSTGMAGAATYEFESGISYLEHCRYYTWNIIWTVPDGEQIDGAALFFEDIANHDAGTNDLYLQLLPGEASWSGVSVGTDGGDDGNYFSGQGILLEHWQDLPDTLENRIYVFDSFEVNTLIQYVADGNFGIGFDPDCLYEPKITLKVETSAVPVPASFFLLSSGLVGLVGFRRRFFKG